MKTKLKKLLISSLVIAQMLSLTSCWDYRRLTEIDIVTGIAIDKSVSDGYYYVTFEMYDFTNSSKDTGMRSRVIESSGITINEAIKNSKQKLSNRLYLGATQIVIIDKGIAKNDGIEAVLDFMLRNTEIREDVFLAVSQEKTAGELLKSNHTDNAIISYQMGEIIEEDRTDTLAASKSTLFNAYNVLRTTGKSLVLTSFKISEEKGEGQKVVHLGGLAVFKKEKLIDFLTIEESTYYLFVVDQVKSGIIAFTDLENKVKSMTINFKDSNCKYSYEFKNNKFKMFVSCETSAILGSISYSKEIVDTKTIAQLEKISSKRITSYIKKVIGKAQLEFNSDIFGFGNFIYKRNPRFWKSVQKNWDKYLQTMDVSVETKVIIESSSLIR